MNSDKSHVDRVLDNLVGGLELLYYAVEDLTVDSFDDDPETKVSMECILGHLKDIGEEASNCQKRLRETADDCESALA